MSMYINHANEWWHPRFSSGVKCCNGPTKQFSSAYDAISIDFERTMLYVDYLPVIVTKFLNIVTIILSRILCSFKM